MPISFRPNSVEQVSEIPEHEIAWQSSSSSNPEYLLESRWRTVRNLTHISNPATGDLRNKTHALVCTNFQMTNLPSTISGLELTVNAQRNGRIVDEVIQLTYQGQAISKNNFVYLTDSEGHLTLNNQTTYGSATDQWEVELTPEMLQDPTFGVILKFQSHPYYPHSSGMLVESVLLTVY